MKLICLKLTHFKGIMSYSFEPGGNDATVLGDNGTGKTTLLDAFLWVFLGTDSSGCYDFELKTLDEAGRPIPMLDHSVEIKIEQGGVTTILKKTLSECWVRSKGSALSQFSGHKTTYEVNHVPTQKKEFDAFIAALCDEKLLRLLTDPTYFAEKLHWKERRNVLMELTECPSDTDVIANNSQLSPLTALLAGRSIEAYRKVLTARKAIINNELKAIPVRVDEAARALPATGDTDPATVRVELAEARRQLHSIDTALAAASGGNGCDNSEKRLRLAENQRHLESLQRSMAESAAETKRMADLAGQLEVKLSTLRDEWAQVEQEAFMPCEGETCTLCGQALPARLRDVANAKAKSQFLAEQDKRLSAISAAGKTTAAHQAQLQARKQAMQDALTAQQAQHDALAQTIAQLQQELAAAEQQPENSNEQRNERDALQQKIDVLARADATARQRQDGEARIAELQAQEKLLTEEYAELEQRTFLTEEFMRTKVACLEEKINSRFKLARFRLFEQQVNGALNEVCEVLGPDLVPYNSGLNNAARINTGIDIINTLSEHYGFTAPIFVDNAEAVTQLADTPAQLIRLVVAAGEKALRVVEDVAGTQGTQGDAAPLKKAAYPETPQKGPGF